MANRKEYEMAFLLNAALNGNFKGTFTKAQQEFAQMGKEIQALNRLQSDISSYQKQQTAIQNTASKLENLKAQHDLLQKEISETTGSTANLEREKLNWNSVSRTRKPRWSGRIKNSIPRVSV